MGQTIGYIAQGKLFIKRADCDAYEVQSQFVERANERAKRDADRHGWRDRDGSVEERMASGLIWRGGSRGQREISRMVITGAARGNGSEVLFALETDSVGGLFAHDLNDQSERRLYHKQGLLVQHLARHPAQDMVALSMAGSELSSHVAITDTQGRQLREVTEGDSIDQSPSWAPGNGQKLVFQSAGVARNQRGMAVAAGAYRIEELDLDAGTMSTLVDDDRFDYLSPHVGPDGSLYYIKRPWQSQQRPITFWKMVQDTLYFPYRLVRTFIYFFNFMSMAFSGKPLLSAGGPQRPKQDTTTMMLWGRMIDAEKALKSSRNGEPVSLAPSDWQLVRRLPDGSETVLAKCTLAFDIAPDGVIYHTDGSRIFRRDLADQTAEICTGKMIEQVIAL